MKEKKPFDYDFIKADYELQENSFIYEDERLYEVKEAIEHLTRAEKRILLTYIELGTYSDTAKEYNVCGSTVKAYIEPIIDKLRCYLTCS